MNDPNIKPTNTRTNAITAFEQRAQVVLRDSVEHFDGRTLSRLTQARHAALDAARYTAKARSQWWSWKLLAPLSAAAAAMVLAISLALNPSARTGLDSSSTLFASSFIEEMEGVDAELPDKLEIIAGEDSLEFYRDVDFYAWLESELDANGDVAPAEQPTLHEPSSV